jgi:hypothetical protein
MNERGKRLVRLKKTFYLKSISNIDSAENSRLSFFKMAFSKSTNQPKILHGKITVIPITY